MESVTISQIVERLRELPAERLAEVYDFVSYLADHAVRANTAESEAWQTMLASEAVLRRDWDRPEEDVAWADPIL